LTKSKSKAPPAQAAGRNARRDGADALTAGITDLADKAPLEFHPFANIFPLMEGAEFDALVADIKKNGCREPLVLYEDKILDGRNRYRACRAAGVPFDFNKGLSVGRLIQDQSTHWKRQGIRNDKDALALVISANIYRRHLTAEQKRDLLVRLVAQQPAKSDRAIAREAGITDHKQVSRARKRGETTGAIAPVDERKGADGRTRKQPTKRKADKPKNATTDATAEPTAKPTRAEILNTDRWWAVCLADNDIENAQKLHALLLDEERRVAFIETLGKAIDAVVKDDKKNDSSDGNDVDPVTSEEMIALIRKINVALKPKGEAIRINQNYGHPEDAAGAGRYERVQLMDDAAGGLVSMRMVIDKNVDPLKVAEELGIAETTK
jgi:hypothetical protein